MDGTSGVEIDGMEMVDEEVQSFTDNMNRATADFKLGSFESAPEKGSQGEDTTATTQATIQRTTTTVGKRVPVRHLSSQY